MTPDHPVIAPKKLIEVALPLDAINKASVREGYIYRGNPSALHKWWAQRPLAAARAVLFAQLVNDPSWKWEPAHRAEIPPNHLKASWAAKRKQLFDIIKDLVIWENMTNAVVLERARQEIRKSWRETCEANKDHPQAAELFDPKKLPAFHDPFAGGGTIPLEAQRLGLEAYASDLNPVAVLINKALIEIPPKFAGRPPVNPEARRPQPRGGKRKGKKGASGPDLIPRTWKGADGLADDVRYYGNWVRDEAEKRIGHLYPKVEITAEMAKERPDLTPLVGQKLTVIAWLWARTVKSPNPAFSHVAVPLISTFMLSTKRGKEAYVEPVMEDGGYRFVVRVGTPADLAAAKRGTKLGRGANFRCVMSGAAISGNYIKAEGQARRMGARLMAVVALGNGKRIYIAATQTQELAALVPEPEWKPDVDFFQNALGFRVGNYGMAKWSDLFTSRQLTALKTLADLVCTAREQLVSDDCTVDLAGDKRPLSDGGSGATAYADALAVLVSFGLSKASDYNCTLVPWYTKESRPGHLFSKQAIPMVWDFVELNPLSDIGGSFAASIGVVAGALSGCTAAKAPGQAAQGNASELMLSEPRIFSTDPPYYDNIGYADLSDFFYVWLRRALRPVFPGLFATIAVPKSGELVATPGRHGTKSDAESFFLTGMTRALRHLAQNTHAAFPATIYYAFKQSATNAQGTTSAGWETFLKAVVQNGLAVSGTWPMRTERTNRARGLGSNALASSVVIVCRQRPTAALNVSRRTFQRELCRVLPQALDAITRSTEGQHAPVAPVDLSQAIIGPGMAVFSKYSAVLEADGSPMSVRTALQLINRFLAEDDFEADTQFCLRWFEQHGWTEGAFGEADVLARAKGTSVEGVKQAGVLHAAGGKVRLLKWADYPGDWDPKPDARLPVWEVLHQLVRVFKIQGETGAGRVLAAIAHKTEAARQLAYRLYTLCERAGRAEDARAYNELITSWSAIESAAAREATPAQASLFEM